MKEERAEEEAEELKAKEVAESASEQKSLDTGFTTFCVILGICAVVACVFGQNTNRLNEEGEPLLDKFESSGYEQFTVPTPVDQPSFTAFNSTHKDHTVGDGMYDVAPMV